MVWLLSSLWFLSVLVMSLFHLLHLREVNQMHRQEKKDWLVLEERLLNRCMTKEWTSYAQMSSGMSVSSNYEGEGIGLSDESEAAAWAAAHGGLEGLGETYVEVDARDLGLIP